MKCHLNDKESMCRYYSSKLDIHIGKSKIASMKCHLNDKESMCRYCSCKLDIHIYIYISQKLQI